MDDMKLLRDALMAAFCAGFKAHGLILHTPVVTEEDHGIMLSEAEKYLLAMELEARTALLTTPKQEPCSPPPGKENDTRDP